MMLSVRLSVCLPVYFWFVSSERKLVETSDLEEIFLLAAVSPPFSFWKVKCHGHTGPLNFPIGSILLQARNDCEIFPTQLYSRDVRTVYPSACGHRLFVDLRTDSGSSVDENLRTRTNADPVRRWVYLNPGTFETIISMFCSQKRLLSRYVPLFC